jgi:hypothetical protein
MLGHVLARMLFEARGMRRLEARTAAKKSKPRRAVWVKESSLGVSCGWRGGAC